MISFERSIFFKDANFDDDTIDVGVLKTPAAAHVSSLRGHTGDAQR
jgi:hypothetical protein